ncbi:hypothetical protein V6N11_044498 [Hibiscus sabdariffa]|uniref:Uncharacterized protein n=1 Tax=Hibiscus sabdariffa TaxID=183260 RepID=A0ABR2RFC6_9ROSI
MYCRIPVRMLKSLEDIIRFFGFKFGDIHFRFNNSSLATSHHGMLILNQSSSSSEGEIEVDDGRDVDGMKDGSECNKEGGDEPSSVGGVNNNEGEIEVDDARDVDGMEDGSA